VDENAVIEAVCQHLERDNYRIVERRRTTEHGIDIVAQHADGRRRYLIEAKGGTSSRLGSARHGQAYTQSQVFDVVSKGLLVAMRLRAEHPDRAGTSVALAVPDGRWFDYYLQPLSAMLKSLDIEVLIATPDLQVRRL
jgi:hypothetical protein